MESCRKAGQKQDFFKKSYFLNPTYSNNRNTKNETVSSGFVALSFNDCGAGCVRAALLGRLRRQQVVRDFL